MVAAGPYVLRMSQAPYLWAYAYGQASYPQKGHPVKGSVAASSGPVQPACEEWYKVPASAGELELTFPALV